MSRDFNSFCPAYGAYTLSARLAIFFGFAKNEKSAQFIRRGPILARFCEEWESTDASSRGFCLQRK